MKEVDWPIRPVTLDAASLLDIEREIGCSLPDDYKDFLCKFTEHKTVLGPQLFRLWKKEDLISINREDEVFEYLPNMLGIGSNCSGELIAIEKADDGRLRIVLTPFIFDNKEYLEIGESFTDFILNMDNGREWFQY